MSKKLLFNNKPNTPISEFNIIDFISVEESKTITLQNYRAGDISPWDGLTDWGDGTIDTSLTHTYNDVGTYTVKTKYLPIESLGNGQVKVIYNTVVKVKEVKQMNSRITNFESLFYYNRDATSINVSNLNSSNTTSLSGMFAVCSTITSLDLSNFDTSKVIDMSWVFNYCLGLASLDLSNFDTSNVTTMEAMFASCESLTSLDLSNFDTSKVLNMNNMFYNCNKLTFLDLSNFKLNNDTTITDMFFDCTSLTRANITLTNVSPEDILRLESAGMPK